MKIFSRFSFSFLGEVNVAVIFIAKNKFAQAREDKAPFVVVNFNITLSLSHMNCRMFFFLLVILWVEFVKSWFDSRFSTAKWAWKKCKLCFNFVLEATANQMEANVEKIKGLKWFKSVFVQVHVLWLVTNWVIALYRLFSGGEEICGRIRRGWITMT